MTDFSRNLVGYWDWRTRNGAGDFVNLANPGTGDATPVGFAGDDSELVDSEIGQVIDFGIGLNKYLTCGAVFDFTSQEYSACVWVNNIGTIVNDPVLFGNGTYNTDGWYAQIFDTGCIRLNHSSPAGTQLQSNAGYIVPGVRVRCLCFTRQGTVGRIYMDGVEVAYAFTPPLLNPISTVSNFVIGTYVSVPLTYEFSGYYGPLLLWEGRALGATDVWKLNKLGPRRIG